MVISSRKFDSYNSRRYSAPWGALVKWNDGELRPTYKFCGVYDADARIVEIMANPGDVVAFGQKDNCG